jgi:hypothetical protein
MYKGLQKIRGITTIKTNEIAGYSNKKVKPLPAKDLRRL